jgi:asparagine synthase (glutamine-hydrolysing)
VHIKEYWDVPCRNGNLSGRKADEGPIIEKAGVLLKEAISKHLNSDVPLGVFLSGGIDSTTVNYFAVQSSRSKIDSFSIGFDIKEHSEIRYAEIAADFLGVQHYKEEVTKRMMEEAKDFVIQLYDEPFGDGSAVSTYFLSKLTRNYVKVALSGDGGDELFWGYKWYSEFLGWKSKITECRRGDDIDTDIEFYASCMGAFLRDEKRGIFKSEFLKTFRDYDDYWYFRKYWRKELPLSLRLQYLDFKTYLPDDILTKVDRASMAVSLEVRVPLLDHKLIEFIFSVPEEIRNRNLEKKYLLKQIIKDTLPSAIINREKKGFSVPYRYWFTEGDMTFHGNNITLPKVNTAALSGSKKWALGVLNYWVKKLSI